VTVIFSDFIKHYGALMRESSHEIYPRVSYSIDTFTTDTFVLSTQD